MAATVDFETLKQHYATLAPVYENRWALFNSHAHHWVLSRLDNPTDIMDVGCGTGLMLTMIQNRFPEARLSGIDASPAMLKIATARLPDANYYITDVENMKKMDQTYDVVCSINVLHHLNDPVAHIRQLHRLCRRGGTVFLCDFAIDTPQMKILELYWRFTHPAHHMAFSQKALRAMLEKKFRIGKAEILNPGGVWRLQIYQMHPKILKKKKT